jgi:hypothetical protein
MLRRVQITGTVLFVGPLLFLSMSCAPPLRIFWDDHRPVLSPQQGQAQLQAQGRLIVYSERYDKPDEDSSILIRRPIQLYDDEGQFLAEYNDTPVNDDPISVWLPPGRYIVVSEAQWGVKQVQVEVQDGQTTVVPEPLLEQIPVAAS